MTKIFNLSGVSSDLQLGKIGPRLIYQSGIVSLSNANNTDLVRFQAATAEAADDVINKSYLETYVEDALENFTGVFRYMGRLEGSTDIGEPFDLDALNSDTGDYYAVSVSGYFAYSAHEIYANAGDGLIKSPIGWDLTDNTDRQAQGIEDRITITNFTEQGFTVDIAETYIGQNSISVVGTVTAGEWQGNTVGTQYGGTGLISYDPWDLLVGGTGDLELLGIGDARQVLRVNDSGELEYNFIESIDVNFYHEDLDATNVYNAIVEINTMIENIETDRIVSSNTSVVVNGDGVEFYDDNTKFIDMHSAIDVYLNTFGDADDVSLVVNPKGAGTLDVSASRISNVSDPVYPADALNRGFADSRYTNRKVISVFETNDTYSVPMDGYVMRITIIIISPFNISSHIYAGISSSLDSVVADADLDITEIGIYEITTASHITDELIITTNGSGSGEATVIIEYAATG